MDIGTLGNSRLDVAAGSYLIKQNGHGLRQCGENGFYERSGYGVASRRELMRRYKFLQILS